MARPEPGDRVYVAYAISDEVVYFIGYGVYLGEVPRDKHDPESEVYDQIKLDTGERLNAAYFDSWDHEREFENIKGDRKLVYVDRNGENIGIPEQPDEDDEDEAKK